MSETRGPALPAHSAEEYRTWQHPALRAAHEQIRVFIDHWEPENPRTCEKAYVHLWEIEAILKGKEGHGREEGGRSTESLPAL